MVNIKQTDLDTVHRLYSMQIVIQDLLETDLKTPEQKKEAKKCLREFSQLLKSADARYMGGEDVLEELGKVPEEVKKKIGK